MNTTRNRSLTLSAQRRPTLATVLLLAAAFAPTNAFAAGLSVTEATYGAGCGVPLGNQTGTLAAACNGRSVCSYVVDYRLIGDPSPGCAKSYEATYSCNDGSPLRSAFSPPEAGLGSVLQLACANVGFPVEYETPTDYIDGDYHFWMETDVKISANGRLDWTTTTASSYWLRGFTGGQNIVLTDANDNVLWTGAEEQFGHGGTWVNGGPRVDNGVELLPPDVMSQVAKIAVLHYNSPHNRLAEDLTIGAKVGGSILPLLVALFGA
jgi:hypothetical protein